MEGPDGSGKTTQIEELKKFFNDKAYEVVITREPGELTSVNILGALF